ncbi:MAG: hypothetical protein M0P63_19840, partial [Azoarcus sp.]|nr:hypothetical protein [Azoarcus sp.]
MNRRESGVHSALRNRGQPARLFPSDFKAPHDRGQMKRKLIVPLLAVVVLGGGGVYFWQRTHYQAPPATTLTLYGNVDIRQVQLAFNGTDRIEHMLVREGEAVHKGQPLATLDTT